MTSTLVEMNNEITRSSQLRRAMDTASKELLRSVINDLCRKFPYVEDRLAEMLLVTEDQVRQEGNPTGEDATDSDESDESDDVESVEVQPAGSKRLRSRYAFCKNCDEEFDVTTNNIESCRYHPEDAEVDREEFPDHDEFVHGPMDTPENRNDFPEKFIYPCCDRYGDEDPCTVGRHKESSKRQKM